ncbi:hypothetical protein KAH94_02980, partial [bacterium]|nr:hypothetical protein [bacterium]
KIISNALKTIKKSVPELLGLATIMGIMTKLLNLFCITSPHILNSIPLPITGYKSILVVLIFSVPKLLFWIVPKTFWIVGITTLYQKKNKTTQ